ncbi:UPAR/Ly6 domain-containing protein crok-like [Babylonia areolata]|uniref:UPAR/Ly6 domain-containing protein crok-like n=1 Tax=Babylonia areolata TaxID=304850 RepID=UPI003FD1D024
MGSFHFIVAVAFLLVVLAGEGFALECVECNSFVKPECDSNPAAFSVRCNDSATSCRKMEQEIYYDDDYQVRTIRQCAYESGPLECIERTGTYRFKVFYCHCDKDDCNGAGSLSISLTLAALSSVVALLFKV